MLNNYWIFQKNLINWKKQSGLKSKKNLIHEKSLGDNYFDIFSNNDYIIVLKIFNNILESIKEGIYEIILIGNIFWFNKFLK